MMAGSLCVIWIAAVREARGQRLAAQKVMLLPVAAPLLQVVTVEPAGLSPTHKSKARLLLVRAELTSTQRACNASSTCCEGCPPHAKLQSRTSPGLQGLRGMLCCVVLCAGLWRAWA